VFATQDGAGVSPTFVDHMTLTRDGRLGIGKVPASGYKLDVDGTINATAVWENGQSISAMIGSATSGISVEISQITDIQHVFNSSKNSTAIDAFSDIPNYGFWAVKNESTNRPDASISQYYCITQGGNKGEAYEATGQIVQYAFPYGGQGDSNNSNYMYIRRKVGDSSSSPFTNWGKIQAGRADTLKTARNINGVPFDGSRDIYVDLWSNVTGSTSNIYYGMGNVSLGANAAPAQLLHLQKAGTSNFIRIDAGSTVSGVTSFAGMMLCKQADPTGYSIRYDGSSSDTLFVSKTNNIGAFTSNIVSIKNTGNVGIGTDDPGQLMHLQKPNTNNFVRVDASTSYVAGMMLCKPDNSGYGIRYDNSTSDVMYVSRFNTSGASTSNIVSIKNTGNVGIGTDDPGVYRIGVYGGDTYVNNNAYVNSSVGIGTASVGSYKLNVYGGDAYFDRGVYARGDIISSFSDIRLKEVVAGIDDPLEKIMNITAFKYIPNALARSLQVGIANKIQVGISAQDVRQVLPEVVTLAPFDSCNLDNGQTVSKSGQDYLTVAYERMVPLLIECIKQLKSEVAELREEVNLLKESR
jgi:hypothetical protein